MGSGASKRPTQQSVQAYKPDADLAAKVQSLEKQLEASRAALAPKAAEGAWVVPGKPVLTLEAADEMCNVALKEAKTRKFADISVFVVDATGRTIVSKTMLGVPTLPVDLALAKAQSCVGMNKSTRALRERYVPDKTPQLIAMTTIGVHAGKPLAAFPGGVLCRDAATNAVVGAVGVSGAAADEDEHCAITAAQAVGLVTEPATSALKAAL